MKMSRGVSVVGLSAAVVATGWAAGSGTLSPPSSTGALTHTVTSGPVSAGTTTPTSGATTSPTPAGVSGTFDGQAVNEPYGTMQVEITVEAGAVTKVAMLQEGSGDPTSRSINAYAIPQLTQEVLSAQSATVQGISGASFTSAAFVESMASAIAAAGLS